MILQLIGISGTNKGATWSIGDEALVLGRSADCDITLSDPVVSRRHCRLVREGNKVRYEDLGSRNPALINGLPIGDGVLRVGDEIAIGEELFLLTSPAVERRRATAQKGTEPGTLILGAGAPMGVDSAGAVDRPRTVHDLADLYEAAREFSESSTMAELVATLGKRLRERFNPRALWIARVHGEDDLTLYDTGRPGGDPAATFPHDTVQRALREGRGLLAPRARGKKGTRVHVSTLVAPVALSGLNLAAVVLQTESPHGAYHEADLRFLNHLGAALAPFVHAVENGEQLRRDNERLRTRAGESQSLVGESRAMGRVRSQVTKAAKADLHVLITGETGTGKELIARMVHAQSARHAGPLIIVNCAAIPRDLFESELFGYEKGAFTGAHQASVGLFAQAHGGTLFLDEIGDLSLDNQARILRAIEYGTFRRIGAQAETHVDLRVVAATNKDIGDGIDHGVFREDLYHRLNGFDIRVPSLRQRPSDVPVLAQHFFEMYKGQAKRPLTGIAPEALAYLRGCPWPGNVRELRNCIQRATAVARQSVIQVEDLLTPSSKPSAGRAKDRAQSLVDVEKQHIGAVLHQCGGNVRQAAQILQIGRSTLYKKLVEYGMS